LLIRVVLKTISEARIFNNFSLKVIALRENHEFTLILAEATEPARFSSPPVGRRGGP
jgi:hypothetical protein